MVKKVYGRGKVVARMNEELKRSQDGRGVPAGSERQSLEKTRFVPSSERRGRKVRATFHISAELLDELRDVAVALSGPPDRLTLSDLAEGALRREVDRLKRVHTKGKTFQKRTGQLKGGRPIR
ncbi:MAG: hypothetical protein ACYDAB_04310 [bacterium]